MSCSHEIYLWVTTGTKTVSCFAGRKTLLSNERAKQFAFLLDSHCPTFKILEFDLFKCIKHFEFITTQSFYFYDFII